MFRVEPIKKRRGTEMQRKSVRSRPVADERTSGKKWAYLQNGTAEM